MTRFVVGTTCALCLALSAIATAPVAALNVERKTRAAAIKSLRDYDKCEAARANAGSETCLEGLKVYVKRHPKHAFEAGKRARRHAMHWVLLDFFSVAFSRKTANVKQRCADEDVRAAVFAGLALPSHYPQVALAQKLAMETCREPLASLVIAEVGRASGAFRDNVCPLVAARDELRAPVADFCSRAEPRASTASAPAALAPPAAEPTSADQLAKVAELRRPPLLREETPPATRAQRLSDVFPAIGALPKAPGRQKAVALNTRPAAAPLPVVVEARGSAEQDVEARGSAREQDMESAEFLRGAHGEELLIASMLSSRAEPRASTAEGGARHVLLKFKGIHSPWDERLLIASERPNSMGKDYVVEIDGRETVVLIERQRQYQAFPKGVKGGIWLNPVLARAQDFKFPSRRRRAAALASAARSGK